MATALTATPTSHFGSMGDDRVSSIDAMSITGRGASLTPALSSNYVASSGRPSRPDSVPVDDSASEGDDKVTTRSQEETLGDSVILNLGGTLLSVPLSYLPHLAMAMSDRYNMGELERPEKRITEEEFVRAVRSKEHVIDTGDSGFGVTVTQMDGNEENQDTYTVRTVTDKKSGKKRVVGGMFDGHSHSDVAQWASKYLPSYVDGSAIDDKALKHQLQVFTKDMRAAGLKGGSTGTASQWDEEKNQVMWGTIGDSHLVTARLLDGKIVTSLEHKGHTLLDPKERERIKGELQTRVYTDAELTMIGRRDPDLERSIRSHRTGKLDDSDIERVFRWDRLFGLAMSRGLVDEDAALFGGSKFDQWDVKTIPINSKEQGDLLAFAHLSDGAVDALKARGIMADESLAAREIMLSAFRQNSLHPEGTTPASRIVYFAHGHDDALADENDDEAKDWRSLAPGFGRDYGKDDTTALLFMRKGMDLDKLSKLASASGLFDTWIDGPASYIDSGPKSGVEPVPVMGITVGA